MFVTGGSAVMMLGTAGIIEKFFNVKEGMMYINERTPVFLPVSDESGVFCRKEGDCVLLSDVAESYCCGNPLCLCCEERGECQKLHEHLFAM